MMHHQLILLVAKLQLDVSVAVFPIVSVAEDARVAITTTTATMAAQIMLLMLLLLLLRLLLLLLLLQ